MTRPFIPRSTGVATARTHDGRQLTFHCDPAAHCVRIVDARGRACGVLGRPGAGALDTPLDVTVVRPPMAGPRVPMVLPGLPDAEWVAVADYGHRCIQVFDLDGTHIAAIDLSDEPGLGAPCGVSWHAPMLEVEGLDGCCVEISLGARLLASQETPATVTRAIRATWPAREAVN